MKQLSKMRTNPDIISPYWKWEEAIVRILEEKLECTTSDAQGIMDAQPFLVQQSWTKDLTAEQTAALIIDQSTPKPKTALNCYSFTSAPLFRVVDCEVNRSYYPGLINKYLTNPPSYCIVVNV